MRKKYVKPEITDFSFSSVDAQLFSNESPEGMCLTGTDANACSAGTGASGGPGQCLTGSSANFDCITGNTAQGSVCANGYQAANQGGQCRVGASPK